MWWSKIYMSLICQREKTFTPLPINQYSLNSQFSANIVLTVCQSKHMNGRSPIQVTEVYRDITETCVSKLVYRTCAVEAEFKYICLVAKLAFKKNELFDLPCIFFHQTNPIP